MKETSINTNEEVNEKTDLLLNIENKGGADKYKNRIDALFKEFEHDAQNFESKLSSAINFSEKELELRDGCKCLAILLTIMFLSLGLIAVFASVGAANKKSVELLFIIPIPVLSFIVSFILVCCLNFVTIPPGYALVLTYYGKYMGTCKKPGYYWKRPCSERTLISLKSTQFNGNMIKVNDKDGSPVLIGVVAVYHISDTVKATYGINDSGDTFIRAQTESAIRFIANKFRYDSVEENEPTLKSGSEEINELLKLELQRRTRMAGIEIEDARITEISYGTEIASLMLQKQAADAIINSKAKIAKGAVDIIDNSIRELEQRNVCRFKDEEKCKLVGSMMIVLNMDKGGNAIIKTSWNINGRFI